MGETLMKNVLGVAATSVFNHRHVGKTEPLLGSVLPIWGHLATSLNSLARRWPKLGFENCRSTRDEARRIRVTYGELESGVARHRLPIVYRHESVSGPEGLAAAHNHIRYRARRGAHFRGIAGAFCHNVFLALPPQVDGRLILVRP